MAATNETREFRQAIRRARKAWAALHRAKNAMVEAWASCPDPDRRAVCSDEGLLVPTDAYELFRDLGA